MTRAGEAAGSTHSAASAQPAVTVATPPARRPSSASAQRLGAWPAILALLAVQNGAWFWRHYAGEAGFPWDFPLAYHGATLLWTEAQRLGVPIDWVPFQGGGFPLAMMQQSGAGYLPLWAFPLAGAVYTLHAAVVVQALHVLLGGVGAALWLRVLGLPGFPVAIGAVAFQAFGGFYANAEHPDIVRGYAWAPWLLACASVLRVDGTLAAGRWRLAALPVVTLLALGGVYPGQMVSLVLVCSLYVLLQAAARSTAGGSSRRLALADAALALAGLAAGVLLAAHQWLAPLALRSEVGRFLQAAAIGLEWPAWSSIVVGNKYLGGEVSMTNAYVAMPLVAAALVLPGIVARAAWPVLGTLAIAALLSMGPGSVLYGLLREWLPPLAYSRFPSADYRAFVGLGVIVAGATALAGMAHGAFRPSRWRIALCALVLLQAAWTGLGGAPGPGNDRGWIAFATVSALALGTLAVHAWRPLPARLLGVLALTLALLDPLRTLAQTRATWRVDTRADPSYARVAGSFEASAPAVGRVLLDPPASRPARTLLPVGGDAFFWSGFLRGDYQLTNFPRVLRAGLAIEADPALAAYMAAPWTPRWRCANDSAGARGEQRRYGTTLVEYRLELDRACRMIENEVYFPGWTMRLEPGGILLAAEREADVLRAWSLPAGSWSAVARFETPMRRPSWALVSLGGAGALAVAWMALRRRRPVAPWAVGGARADLPGDAVRAGLPGDAARAGLQAGAPVGRGSRTAHSTTHP